MSQKIRVFFISILFVLSVFFPLGCSLGPRADLDPASRNFYEYAQLIMSKQERDIFNHLPDAESRQEFIADFWEKRDPDPGTEFNEFREEFYNRIDYANERFMEGIPGWKTDRGRIYIYFGAPDQQEIRPMVDNPQLRGYKGYIWWQYYRYGFAVMFVDKRGDGAYTFEPFVGTVGEGGGIVGDFFDAMERARLGLPPRSVEFQQRYLDFDFKYDKSGKEFRLEIPANSVTFLSEGDLLQAEFDFLFVFYRKKSPEKYSFKENRLFSEPETETVKLKKIEFVFTFPSLASGKYYVDVVITGRADTGKARKIFDINY